MSKKIVIFFITFLSIVISASAQVEEQDYESNSGGFGSIMFSLRKLDSQMAIYSGGGGGFMINDFRIGVFYNGLTNFFSQRDTSTTSYKLGCSYGGIWIGYPLLKEKRLHLIADMKFSIGNTRLIDTNWQQINNGIFFGFTPSFGVEYAATDFLMLCAGIEYHYSLFPETPQYYIPQSFSSPGIYMSVKLGTF
ncbi:MAG: hypothetical protein PHP52_08220 [Bacteroidales bacterium]|nr:hypothetical protein [Bacteroidales bacterium]MDY0140988.1 hypothetical protein [Bacteroidales bacterium]